MNTNKGFCKCEHGNDLNHCWTCAEQKRALQGKGLVDIAKENAMLREQLDAAELTIEKVRDDNDIWRQRIADFCDNMSMPDHVRDGLITIIAHTVGDPKPLKMGDRWVPENLTPVSIASEQ